MLPLDHSLFLFLNADASTPAAIVGLAKWLTLVLPMVLGGTIIGALMFAPAPVQRDLLVTVLGIGAAALIAYAIRQHWPMPRPSQLDWGIQWIAHAERASFPSMHATQAFALAQGLLLSTLIRATPRGRTAIALVWVCALAIGWSRVCLGLHSPSDILGGAILGIATASITALAARRLALTARGRSSAYSSRPAHP